eukprot:1978656-Pyramimonas_sp.AAC.1
MRWNPLEAESATEPRESCFNNAAKLQEVWAPFANVFNALDYAEKVTGQKDHKVIAHHADLLRATRALGRSN